MYLSQDDPSGARAGLEKLLEAAKERVPEEHRSTTPITLKATAGLRLLPKEKSEAIIAEVRDVLLNSGLNTNPVFFPFALCKEDQVMTLTMLACL